MEDRDDIEILNRVVRKGLSLIFARVPVISTYYYS